MTKIQVRKINLQKIEGHPSAETCTGLDAWEQGNRTLRTLSTFTNRNNKVNFTITYEDGHEYKGRLELPWFETAVQTEPYPDLGRHILEFLEQLPQFSWFSPSTCELVRQDVLVQLKSYEIGGDVLQNEVAQSMQRIQLLDFSHFPLLHPHNDSNHSLSNEC